eukprot:3656344-Rhodomonas_salina.1
MAGMPCLVRVLVIRSSACRFLMFLSPGVSIAELGTDDYDGLCAFECRTATLSDTATGSERSWSQPRATSTPRRPSLRTRFAKPCVFLQRDCSCKGSQKPSKLQTSRAHIPIHPTVLGPRLVLVQFLRRTGALVQAVLRGDGPEAEGADGRGGGQDPGTPTRNRRAGGCEDSLGAQARRPAGRHPGSMRPNAILRGPYTVDGVANPTLLMVTTMRMATTMLTTRMMGPGQGGASELIAPRNRDLCQRRGHRAGLLSPRCLKRRHTPQTVL